MLIVFELEDDRYNTEQLVALVNQSPLVVLCDRWAIHGISEITTSPSTMMKLMNPKEPAQPKPTKRTTAKKAATK